MNLIHNVVGRNLNVMFQTEYDDSRKKYGIIVKELVVPKDPTEKVDKDWNVFQNKTVLL